MFKRVRFEPVPDNHGKRSTTVVATSADLSPQDQKVLASIRFAALSVELGDGKPVRFILDGKSPAAGARLEKALHRYARLALDELRTQKAADDEDKLMMKLGTELAQSRQVHRQGARVEWLGFSSVRVGDLINLRPGQAK